MSREIATLGRSLNDFSVDRLDTCNEVTLGLCSTLCVTLAILAVFLPVFDVAGMSWISSWEGQHNGTWPTPAPTYWVDMAKVKEHLLDEYSDTSEAVSVAKGFDAVDSNHNQRVTEPELEDHSDIVGLDKQFAASLYKRMDPSDEGSVTKDMWMAAFAVAPESPPTPAPTSAAVPEPVPRSDQFQSKGSYTDVIQLSESYSLDSCEQSLERLRNDPTFVATLAAGVRNGLHTDQNCVKSGYCYYECFDQSERLLADEEKKHDPSQGPSRSVGSKMPRWMIRIRYVFTVMTDTESEKDETEGKLKTPTFVKGLNDTIRLHPAVGRLMDPHVEVVETIPPASYRLVPPEIVHFKNASIKAAGSLLAMCKQLDLSGSHPARISLDEFVTVCQMSADDNQAFEVNPFGLFLNNHGNCTEEELKKRMFDYFDQDKDGVISEVECEISLEWLAEQLRPMGDASTIMTMNDLDQSGSLDEKEFSRLADLADPPVPRGSMALLFYEVDADHDGVVSLIELKNTEACANPVSCAGIVAMHSVVGNELAQYDNIPAILSGVVLIYYKVSVDDETPGEEQANALGLVFGRIFKDAFGYVVDVHKPESTSLNLGADNDLETKRRKVQFNFGGESENGGKYHRDIQNRENLARFYSEYSSVYNQTAFLHDMPQPQLWCKMEVNYYGPSVQDGHLHPLMLQQHFGTTPDSRDFLVKRHYQCEPEVEGEACSEDGSPPFYMEDLS